MEEENRQTDTIIRYCNTNCAFFRIKPMSLNLDHLKLKFSGYDPDLVAKAYEAWVASVD